MMRPHAKDDTRESNQSLWLLIAPPTIWAAHFLASYLTAAIWCAKYAGPDRSLGNVPAAIAIYTVLALTGIGYSGFVGYRRNQFEHRTLPLDRDTPEDRHRFLGFATLLLCGMSVIATVFVSLAAYFMETCY